MPVLVLLVSVSVVVVMVVLLGAVVSFAVGEDVREVLIHLRW